MERSLFLTITFRVLLSSIPSRGISPNIYTKLSLSTSSFFARCVSSSRSFSWYKIRYLQFHKMFQKKETTFNPHYCFSFHFRGIEHGAAERYVPTVSPTFPCCEIFLFDVGATATAHITSFITIWEHMRGFRLVHEENPPLSRCFPGLVWCAVVVFPASSVRHPSWFDRRYPPCRRLQYRKDVVAQRIARRRWPLRNYWKASL